MKKNKGITLIALVITIIVLLILAGVSITALTDEDKGVVSKAKHAAEETEKAAEEEEEDIEDINEYIELEHSIKFIYKNSSGNNVEKTVITDKYGRIEISSIPSPVTYTSGTYTYTFKEWVDSNGNVVESFNNFTSNKTLTAVYTASANESICFVAGTEVLTETGLVNIEDVKVGMKVYSYNEETQEVELKEVKQTFKTNPIKDMVKVTVNGEVVESTSKHEYYVVGKGWTAAHELKEGDVLLNSANEEVKVDDVELIISNGNPVTVYNMEVEDNHNYFVGEENILVHNATASKC